MISHAIREQLLKHKRQYVEELMIDGEIRATLDSAFRNIDDAKKWVPRMDMLSNGELEKLLVAQERNIRFVCLTLFHNFACVLILCTILDVCEEKQGSKDQVVVTMVTKPYINQFLH
jgi:hypothetical protein